MSRGAPAGLWLETELLPVPDDEAVIHALFEIAVGRESMPREPQAFRALVEK
jgi:hypothetical protein